VARHESQEWLDLHVSELAYIALEHRGVPEDVVGHAKEATMVAFQDAEGDPRSVRARSQSYFWKVVRRKVIRRRGPSTASARFVIEAVVADLVEAGRDPLSVWSELQRGWGDKVPGEVLEEYRLRLCA